VSGDIRNNIFNIMCQSVLLIVPEIPAGSMLLYIIYIVLLVSATSVLTCVPLVMLTSVLTSSTIV
jgi:hypothetical protein